MDPPEQLPPGAEPFEVPLGGTQRLINAELLRVCSRLERHPPENLAEARFIGGIAAPVKSGNCCSRCSRSPPEQLA
jgi:hypothetical protein